MFLNESFNKIKQTILESIPKDASVTDIEFEGPEIAIYSRNPKVLLSNGEIVKELAKRLRKRLVIRSDPALRMPPQQAEEEIKKIVPEEAEISSINFDDNVGEVIIEAKKPGLVIGRNGVTLKEITRKIFWRPSVIRTPPIQSRIILQLRHALQKESDKRRGILKKIGQRIHRSVLPVHNGWLRFTALGGFREVGRTCIFVQTAESNVLIDCGINVGTSSQGNSFPRLDMPEFDLDELDAVIITHSHLDHCGFVPFLYKYGYRGAVYCTKATRNLMTLLQLDYLDVAEREGKLSPYKQKDVKNVVLNTIPLDYGEVTDISPDVRLTLHNAGHILGSSIVHLHVGDGLYNIAYTGDFKFSKSRLLEAATSHFPRLETLILESTYRHIDDNMPSRRESERRLVNAINKTVQRKGKVLIPVLAVGRAQEIIVLLEEAIRHKIMEEVPIFIDGMISEATAIHTTHPEYLAHDLRDKIFHYGLNPFLADCFTQVESTNARTDIIEGEPSVILATSGMLTGGPSVDYFRHLATDPKNTVIFVSYQIEGTLGRRIQKGWREIPMTARNGKSHIVNVELNIETVEGFSGHSDRRQLINFAKQVTPKPERVITCHGEKSKCIGLAKSLKKILRADSQSPTNLETIRLV